VRRPTRPTRAMSVYLRTGAAASVRNPSGGRRGFRAAWPRRPRTDLPRRRRDSALLSDTFGTDGIDNARRLGGSEGSAQNRLPDCGLRAADSAHGRMTRVADGGVGRARPTRPAAMSESAKTASPTATDCPRHVRLPSDWRGSVSAQSERRAARFSSGLAAEAAHGPTPPSARLGTRPATRSRLTASTTPTTLWAKLLGGSEARRVLHRIGCRTAGCGRQTLRTGRMTRVADGGVGRAAADSAGRDERARENRAAHRDGLPAPRPSPFGLARQRQGAIRAAGGAVFERPGRGGRARPNPPSARLGTPQRHVRD
jgi:hypothetical protein